MKKPEYKFKDECGKIAISVKGNYTIIVDKELNKYKFHSQDNDIHIHSKSGVITVNVYNAT